MANKILTIIFPYVHIILGIILLIFLLTIFPKEVKKMDPDWLVNNIKPILPMSFGIGGFISVCIGLLCVVLNGSWPSNYIPANSISTSVVIMIIYLGTLIYHDVKSYKKEIKTKYGIVKTEENEKGSS